MPAVAGVAALNKVEPHSVLKFVSTEKLLPKELSFKFANASVCNTNH